MSINSKIARLLEDNRYRFEGKPIAFDGVVDEPSYLKSTLRTVFLLKEINDPGMKEDWVSFMEDTKAQASAESLYKTWPNVCLWMEALKKPGITYSECLNNSGSFATERLQKNLLDVGIVNIKKTAGGGSSKHDEILSAAQNYGYIIRDELQKYIKPQLVICGGTFEYAKLIFNAKADDVTMLPSGAEHFISDGVMYLQFPHPVWYSVNRKILFAYAQAVFNDVREYYEQ